MNLESQLCSLELAKRLKELNVEQESCFWWCDPSDGDKTGVGFIRDNHVGYKVYYSAFTVAELGEMLPEKHRTYRVGTKWYWGVHRASKPPVNEDFVNEADARAAMVCYLIENHLI